MHKNRTHKSTAMAAMLLLTPAFLSGARAQENAQAVPVAPVQGGARAVPAPANYKLGPDDAISIQVINFPELSVPQVTIPPDGKITVPVLKADVPVAGKTTEQVAQMLTKRWTKYVNDPSVTVTLTARRRQSVQFYGHVVRAQAVEYKTDMHLMQALAGVGGVAEDGDLSQVTVTHSDGTKTTLDITNPETIAGTDKDILLAADDVIYVPQRHVEVTVLGEVVKPGIYDYKDKMTVLDALKDADNTNPDTANLPDATLLHKGKNYKLDLDALLVKGDQSQNFLLAPGDRIFIPTLHNRIYVDGAVGHPGYYLFKPGDRLINAIQGSGGTAAGASDLAKVNLVHVDKLNQTVSVQTVDLFRYYQKGDLTANVLLAPGDAIYVPLKNQHRNPLDALGSVLGLVTGFRVLGGR